jgi:hypothetical protein
MNKSTPSSFGKLTSKIFAEYPIYKYEISSELINNYLPNKLNAFESISLINIAKRDFFYSKPILHASYSQINDDYEQLSKTIKLEDILKELLSPTNNITRYNFVITGNQLIFVRIAHLRHFSYHLHCKHITLSNRSNDVRFAGEFWRDENNIFRFNNNSGTYRPSDILIDNTLQLINQLVPNLQFQGISFRSNSRPSFKYRFIYKIKKK